MSQVDLRLAKEIEKILLKPRAPFKSPGEFSMFLASELENIIEAREEVAYRLAVAELSPNVKKNDKTLVTT